MSYLHIAGDPDELLHLSGSSPAYQLSRSDERSFEIANRLAVRMGKPAAIIDLYLGALSYAPSRDLARLERRGTAIVFAPTIDVALLSPWADERRAKAGRAAELTDEDKDYVRQRYGRYSGSAGVFDPDTDALIFPTTYGPLLAKIKHLVLHEVGHALTVGGAAVRPALLEGLPNRIASHVFSPFYEGSTPEETLYMRVFEVLAEGYVDLVEGRGTRLPQNLLSDLTFMLTTMDEGPRVRIDVEQTPRDVERTPRGGFRTASRVTEREIIDHQDPQLGHLFAPPQEGEELEVWRMGDDEMAARRRERGRGNRRDVA